MTRTVTLVATRKRLATDFPELTSRGGSGTILSATYPIRPQQCATQLGRWLAETIWTTRFDDDGSALDIVLPATEAGLHWRALGERLMAAQALADRAAADRLAQEVEEFVDAQRQVYDAYGAAAFALRVTRYAWPVYGSHAVREALTPEAYFDCCAGLVRATGGVIVRGGLDGAALPRTLAATMSGGRGLELLERYRAGPAWARGGAVGALQEQRMH